jgi:mRNA interferase MazF
LSLDEIQPRRFPVTCQGYQNKHLKFAIVAPITAWSPHWEKNPFFVSLEPDSNNGLQKKSAVDCFQISAISHKRFVEKIESILIDLIKKSIALILGIEPEHCE